MNKIILLIVILTVISLMVTNASATIPPWPSYCEHQGYIYKYNPETKEQSCIFKQKVNYDYNSETGAEVVLVDNEEKCDAKTFLDGTCVQQYVKDITCRQIGETVFSEFEKCCIGLGPKSEGFDQTTCQELIFLERIWQWFTTLL